MEIVSCMKGGMIENWDLFEEILDYTLKKVFNLIVFKCSKEFSIDPLFSDCIVSQNIIPFLCPNQLGIQKRNEKN